MIYGTCIFYYRFKCLTRTGICADLAEFATSASLYLCISCFVILLCVRSAEVV